MTLFTNNLGCYDRPYNGEENVILLVGDSFTFGHADFPNKYGTLLERYLDYRILKCGVGGYGTYQEFCKIKKILNMIKVKPKLLIIGYWYGNDMRNDLDMAENGILPNEMLANTDISSSVDYKLTHSADSRLLSIKKWIQGHLMLYYVFNKNILVRSIFSRFGFVDTYANFVPFVSVNKFPQLQKGWQLHLNILKKIKHWTDQQNIKLLIVLLPADFQVYDFLKPKQDIYDFDQPVRMLSAFFKENEIRYFDILPYMRQYANKTPRLYINNQKDFYWREDGHFNDKGNRLVALLLARYILEEKILDIENAESKKQDIERWLEEYIQK